MALPANRLTTVAIVALLLAAAGAGMRLVSGSGETAGPEPITIRGRTMGTTYTVKIDRLPAGVTLAGTQREIEALLDGVNSRMSTYDPQSELSRWNASTSCDWFDVSRETAEVIETALRIGAGSEGALDVTVGPLVNLWHFGPDKRFPDRVPTEAQIESARDRTGLDRVESRLDPPAVRKSHPSLYVDLSAVAKGYAVDRVAEGLDRLGVAGYMVEVGGEVRTAGANAEGNPWRIAVEAPLTEGRAVGRVATLGRAAMATSGDYRNYFEQAGTRYSHIIDPRAGRPIAHRLVSASVIAPSCATADGWATAMMVLGPEEARRVATDQGLAVLLIVNSNDGFEHWASPQFLNYSP